jgi:hypothetical protein
MAFAVLVKQSPTLDAKSNESWRAELRAAAAARDRKSALFVYECRKSARSRRGAKNQRPQGLLPSILR